MNKPKTKSLRRTLITYAIVFSIVSAGFYTLLASFYAGMGITKIFDSLLLIEARRYEREYLKKPTAPPQGSGTIKFYLDSWQAKPYYLKIFPSFSEMTPGEIYDFDEDDIILDTTAPDLGERVIIAYCHLLADGRKLVVVSDIELDFLTDSELSEFDEVFNELLLASLAFSSFSLVLLLLFSRRLFKQTHILTHWVEHLTLAKLHSSKPTLRYSEFNLITEKLQQSMQKIADLAQKEQLFLRNISHELRTPIAVIDANLSLIKRIQLTENIQTPMLRIGRANKNMQLMSETLLWVNRESTRAPKAERLDPVKLVKAQLEQHQYLLKDKDITLSLKITSEERDITLYRVPFEIVIANLIRNALQYTEEGCITIEVSDGILLITNQEQESYQGIEESFGLGINLATQICDKLSWSIDINRSNKSFTVTFLFTPVEH